MVILTADVENVNGVWIATVLNPGAPEGKVFFLETIQHNEHVLWAKILPSPNFPDPGVLFVTEKLVGGLFALMQFDPPLPIEIGVEIKTPQSSVWPVYVTGFYGDPTNVIVNGAPMVVIPGDFNLDGRVDLNDFNTFANHFTG